MQALVLERKSELALRNIELDEALGPHDVRIAIRTVGICGTQQVSSKMLAAAPSVSINGRSHVTAGSGRRAVSSQRTFQL